MEFEEYFIPLDDWLVDSQEICKIWAFYDNFKEPMTGKPMSIHTTTSINQQYT